MLSLFVVAVAIAPMVAVGGPALGASPSERVIAVAKSPSGIAIDPTGARVVVANSESSNLSVIDAGTNTVVKTVPLPANPGAVAFGKDGTKLYVSLNKSILVLDAATFASIATVDGAAGGISVDRKDGLIYAQNFRAPLVAIDPQLNTVVATFKSLRSSIDVATNPIQHHIYVANFVPGRGTVAVIDSVSGAPIARMKVGRSPSYLTVNPLGTRLYTSNYLSDSISVINTINNKVIATIKTEFSPRGMATSPDGMTLYVLTVPNARPTNGELQVINTKSNKITATITVPRVCDGLVLTPSGKQAYCSSASDDSVVSFPLP
jgi:YVTN family beta-propeller protein